MPNQQIIDDFENALNRYINDTGIPDDDQSQEREKEDKSDISQAPKPLELDKESNTNIRVDEEPKLAPIKHDSADSEYSDVNSVGGSRRKKRPFEIKPIFDPAVHQDQQIDYKNFDRGFWQAHIHNMKENKGMIDIFP